METISLRGCCDLHIHSAPDVFERIGNDIQIAEKAKDAGMRAIVLKSPFEPTHSRAWHVMQHVSGIDVFGGVVLDHHVGGINPAAVEPSIQMGGKIVWMPTYHAWGHQQAFGTIGSFGYVSEKKRSYPLEPITIFDQQGKLLNHVITVMDLCQEADIILATGHLHITETLELAKLAKARGFHKLVVNHPLFKVPKIGVEMIGELVHLGAYIEFCANELCPIPESARLQDYVECISRYGTTQFILASDAGHNRKGWPVEELRIFAQLLGYSGILKEQLIQMLDDNYCDLLNLER